jgi:NADPH-dependent ferric siderophore reductase
VIEIRRVGNFSPRVIIVVVLALSLSAFAATVSAGLVAIKLFLTPMKPDRQYSVAWRNNKVRGYTIGVFSTNRSGDVRRGSVRMFRPGEVRGVGIDVYYHEGNTPSGLVRLMPCGPK